MVRQAEVGAVTARDDILANIRDGHGRGALDEATAGDLRSRLATHSRHVIPARVDLDADGLVKLFCDKAEGVQASVEHVAGHDAVPVAVVDYLESENLPARLVIAPDPTVADLPWKEVPMLEVRRGVPTESDEVSVSSAMAGIAETGTLMTLSGPDHPSTLNFTPDTHIVVLSAARIVGAYEDAWDRLRSMTTDGMLPRTVNHITGPSRSGDIEQTILLGAHGPRRLHIIAVNDVGA